MNEKLPDHSQQPENQKPQNREGSKQSLLSVYLMRKDLHRYRAELANASDWSERENLWQKISALREEAHRLYEALQPQLTTIWVKMEEVDAELDEDGRVLRHAYTIPAHEEQRAEVNPNVNFEDLRFIRNFFEEIDLELQGYSFRQRFDLPPVPEQEQIIRAFIDQGNFRAANDWLQTLKGQFDAQSSYHELAEELWIFLEIFDQDAVFDEEETFINELEVDEDDELDVPEFLNPQTMFNPEYSRLAAKVSNSLGEISTLDLGQLPLVIERQQKLLILLDRVENIATLRGWFAHWFVMRSNVLNSFNTIHHRMQELELISQVQGFEEYRATNAAISDTIEELDLLEEKIGETEDGPELQILLAQAEELKEVLKLQYNELDFLVIMLGGDDFHTAELMDDAKLTEYIQRLSGHVEALNASIVNLQKNDQRLAEKEAKLAAELAKKQDDLVLRVKELLTKKDRVQELQERLSSIRNRREQLNSELGPLIQERFSLHRIMLALETRLKNQEIYRKYDELNAPPEESDDESLASA